MHSPDDHVKLKEIYESIALSKDERTTACDFNLRELEIETALESIKDGHDVLDVGCGLGSREAVSWVRPTGKLGSRFTPVIFTEMASVFYAEVIDQCSGP